MEDSVNQDEKRVYLINYLLRESSDYRSISVPEKPDEQWRLLRALMNLRPPKEISADFLAVQDGFLKKEIMDKGITDIAGLRPINGNLYLWRGDITTLKCDGIVNAANSQMLGCFCPNHGCVDNAIHTYAGIQLRLVCAEIMKKQGYGLPTGKAKITGAFNLPSKYILHTVGPIVCGKLTEQNKNELIGCYNSCLALADEHSLRSIAFCCISTGEFGFPGKAAAELAVQAVKEYKSRTESRIKVIFNVFKERDYALYAKLLR